MSEKEKEVIKNYYLNDYINSIRYILTFDPNINNKYIINIKENNIDLNNSELSIEIRAKDKYNFSFNKNIKCILPKKIVKDIINMIKNHFIENHYIVYSSVNELEQKHTLQNEKFTFITHLNSKEEIEAAKNTNIIINSNERNKTKVLSLF